MFAQYVFLCHILAILTDPVQYGYSPIWLEKANVCSGPCFGVNLQTYLYCQYYRDGRDTGMFILRVLHQVHYDPLYITPIHRCPFTSEDWTGESSKIPFLHNKVRQENNIPTITGSPSDASIGIKDEAKTIGKLIDQTLSLKITYQDKSQKTTPEGTEHKETKPQKLIIKQVISDKETEKAKSSGHTDQVKLTPNEHTQSDQTQTLTDDENEDNGTKEPLHQRVFKKYIMSHRDSVCYPRGNTCHKCLVDWHCAFISGTNVCVPYRVGLQHFSRCGSCAPRYYYMLGSCSVSGYVIIWIIISSVVSLLVLLLVVCIVAFVVRRRKIRLMQFGLNRQVSSFEDESSPPMESTEIEESRKK